VLVPVALDQSYSYRLPAGLELAPGDVVAGAARRARDHRVVWADTWGPARADNGCATSSDVAALREELPNSSIGWRATRSLARHGAAHALRMGEHLGPERIRIGVRLAGARRRG